MKKLKYLLFILPFLFISNVRALDYTHINRFAGIDSTKSTGNFIDANSDVIGSMYFQVPKSQAYSYLTLTYCSGTDLINPDVAPNVYISSSVYHVDTRQYCHTNYGNVTGTIKINYFSVKNWYYNDESAYLDISYSYFHNSDTRYSNAFQFLGLQSSTSQDVSIGILTYLKSQSSNQDYSTILNDIKNNQNNYTNELNQVENAINSSNGKLDTVNDNLSNLNDNLTSNDTSDASSEADNFFSGFETDTFGLTSIITAPLNLIGSITSSTCSPLPLKVPFLSKNNTLNLPCFKSIYEEHFGSFLTIYQTITFGLVAYWVCVKIFNLVKDFKNPDHDEIEVLDL